MAWQRQLTSSYRPLVLLVLAVPLLALGCGGGGGGGDGTGSLQGFVYAPSDSGRAQTRQTAPPGFEPVAGVRVLVVDTDQETTTNASGFYRIDEIPEGPQQVAFSGQDFQPEVIQVQIVSGRLQQVEDVLLEPVNPGTGNVEGYLFALGDQLLRDCSPTPPGGSQPLAGITVQTIDGNFQTSTNGEGYFLLQDLPAGQQVLEATRTGFQTLRFGVNVVADETVCVGDQKKWTVMVFMNGDNDLEEFGIQDFNEMERVGSSNEVNLVVQFDRTPGFNSSNDDWTDTRRYLVVKDNDTTRITSPVVEFMGEVDMGDPRRAREFLEWAQQNYPAEHYLFDIWNHGSGWRRSAEGPDPIRRAVSFDDTQGTSIQTTELPGMLDGLDPIDIVAFDSSLMQMMEVAYEIRNRCDIVVGSEESPPGEGYPYHVWVGPLVENPEMMPEQLAGIIVEETVRELGSVFDVTQSALRTERLPGLAAALDGLAATLISRGSTYRQAYADARNQAQRYGFGSSLFAEYKDMVDYVGLLSSLTGDAGIAAGANQVSTALNAALIAEAHAGSSVADSHGLSIWVPSPFNYLTRYGNLAFAKDTRWDEWIRTQGE